MAATESDEMMALLKAINNVELDRNAVRIQTEILDRDIKTLSVLVKVQKAENERNKEMLELLNGFLNREKEMSTAISGCKSTFARGKAQPLLWFARSQVKKSQLLQELKKTDVEKQYQKCIDDYVDQNPKYRQLKEKEMQYVKLQDDLKKKREEIIRFEKFVAEANEVEDMMLQEQIVDLARAIVDYNKEDKKEQLEVLTFDSKKTKPKSTSVAQHNIPVNEEEQLKSFEKCTISAEPIDANVNDISNFKIPAMRRAVKRKPIGTSDEQSRTISSDEKLKLATVTKAAEEASKDPPRSILKQREVKTNKIPSEQAKAHMVEKEESKTVKFVDLNSSIESDIVPLRGTSQQDEVSPSNSKSHSNNDIPMESPNGSDGSDIEMNKENISKEQSFDEDMDFDTSSNQQNTQMSPMTGSSTQANFEVTSNFNFDLNFDDAFAQFTTPKSKPTAASTDANLDRDNGNSSFELDYGRSPSLDFRVSSTFQPTSDDAFNFLNSNQPDDDFSSLFK